MSEMLEKARKYEFIHSHSGCRSRGSASRQPVFILSGLLLYDKKRPEAFPLRGV